MAENSSSSPVFANRYRFQPVSDDWDRGRSGFTHLVFDIKEERLGVIKRAELRSEQAVEGLKNEVAALLDLKGQNAKDQNVPDVYDTGEAEYGSKHYFYMIIEYIDAIRVEKNLDSLSASERKEIIRQLFRLLAKAHGMGVVNGDVDLKHLFWRRNKKLLVVIDWGNSKLDVQKKKQTEFAYDLARAAEIVYSLVTRKGHLPASGSLALPKDGIESFPGIGKIPNEFRELCKWAPRAPVNGAVAPYTAEKLFEASNNWKTPGSKIIKRLILSISLGIVMLALLAVYLTVFGGIDTIREFLSTPTRAPTEIPISASPQAPVATETPTQETIPTITPSQIVENTSTPTQHNAPSVTPSPRTYAQSILLFDQSSKQDSACWENNPSNTSNGFSRRDDGNWRFVVEQEISKDVPVQTGFSKCIDVNQVDAIALSIWIPQIDTETDFAPGREFGIFIVDNNNQRRDYTFWIDKSETMHLTVRENNRPILDEIITIIDDRNLNFIPNTYPRKLARFPIKIFFELDNQGLDILYLKQGRPLEPSEIIDLDPIIMLPPINNAIFQSFSQLQEIGLVGYGGEIQTVIWPLVFLGE